MGFADRAVAAFERAMESGMVSEGHVSNVLRSETDGAFAVRWLGDFDVDIRRVAARVVAEKGPLEELVKAVIKEQDRFLLIDMVGMLGKLGAPVDALSGLLASEDEMVRDAAVDMFVKAGKREYLFPMVFSDDEAVVRRTKRLIDATGKD